MGENIHITKIEGGDVWGHSEDHCDEAGCAAGADRLLTEVDAWDVVTGEVYEIEEDGTVIAEIV